LTVRSIVRLYGNCDVSLAALLVTTTENGHVVTDCDLASRNWHDPMLAGLFSPVPYEYKNSYYASEIAINKIMKNDRKC
jgi:hypothetical protein